MNAVKHIQKMTVQPAKYAESQSMRIEVKVVPYVNFKKSTILKMYQDTNMTDV